MVAHPSIAQLLWPTVNFVLFMVLMRRAAGPQIRAFFADRAKNLREQLAVGAQARRRAAELRAELERELAALPGVQEKLLTEVRETAEQEARRLMETGRAAAERLREDARLLGEQEWRTARDHLRSEFAGEVTQRALGLVRDAVRPEDQRRFLDDFLASASAPR